MIGSGSQVDWALSVVVILCRRLDSTYRYHLQGSRKYFLTLEQGTDRLSPNAGTKLPLYTPLISQKSADIIFKKYKLYPTALLTCFRPAHSYLALTSGFPIQLRQRRLRRKCVHKIQNVKILFTYPLPFSILG